MIIKSILFIIVAYIIQISTHSWYIILIYSFFVGFGGNSYKQSLSLGFLIGAFPWMIQIIIQYSDASILISRVSNMFGINSPTMLIVFSLLFISLLSIMASVSGYRIKMLFNDEK